MYVIERVTKHKKGWTSHSYYGESLNFHWWGMRAEARMFADVREAKAQAGRLPGKPGRVVPADAGAV